MSWNNCRKCAFVPRSGFTTTLLKVLLTLKLLHGTRSGAKGSTLEDIAMHMIKYFSLDGDIKSQVLASLKYGVKLHFIQKNKEKFSLILPASSIHLAPCKYKKEETERINCIFPARYSNTCPGGAVCGGASGGGDSCCGKRKHSNSMPKICCQDTDEEDENQNPCEICKNKSRKQGGDPYNKSKSNKRSRPVCGPWGQNGPSSPKKSKGNKAPCAQGKPSVCSHKKRGGRPKSEYDDYCQFCNHHNSDDDQSNNCNETYNYDAHINCSCCHK